MINSVTLCGNLTRDPEIRRTQSGTAIVSFGIAVNERRKDRQTGEWGDVPHFFDVTCFGERHEKLAQYYGKGSKVTVQGRLSQSSWTDKQSGQKRSKVEVIADEIELPPRQQSQQSASRQAQPAYQPIPAYDDDIPF